MTPVTNYVMQFLPPELENLAHQFDLKPRSDLTPEEFMVSAEEHTISDDAARCSHRGPINHK